MKVPLTVNDFLQRAELIYPDRIGVVDEPDQPAESWGEITYADASLFAGMAGASAGGGGPGSSFPGRGASRRRPSRRPGPAR